MSDLSNKVLMVLERDAREAAPDHVSIHSLDLISILEEVLRHRSRCDLAAPPDAQGGAPVAAPRCDCGRFTLRPVTVVAHWDDDDGRHTSTSCPPTAPPAAPGTEAACPHNVTDEVEVHGGVHARCQLCGAVRWNNGQWSGRSPGQGGAK